MMRGLFVGASLAGVSVQALACDQNSLYTTRQADVTCYGAQPDTSNDAAPAIMAAWRDAVRLGVPLSFPGGRYHVASTLDFDYAAAAGQGVEIQGNGSIIEGAAGVMPLYVHCSGGNPNSPKACFYLHFAGTLHIYANSSWWGAIIDDWTYADAHNSMKIDHLDVNNSGSGSGAILSGVYNADVYIVANANGYFGLQLNRVQFSVFRGAMGAVGGNALVLNDYTFANTFQSLDLEPGNCAWAIVAWQPQVSYNTFISPMINTQNGIWSYGSGENNKLINPMFGGNVTGYANYPGSWQIQ